MSLFAEHQKTVGERIAAARNAKNWKQQDLADMLQISRSLVAAWESGRSNPSEKQLKALASAFQVDYQALDNRTRVLYGHIDLQELTRKMIDAMGGFYSKWSENLRHGAFNPYVSKVGDTPTNRIQKALETLETRHSLDERAHEEVRELVREVILPYFPSGLVLFSEEMIDLGKEDRNMKTMKTDLLSQSEASTRAEVEEYVMIDPLDRTAEALRGTAGFGSITVGSFREGPLISIVFLLFDRHVNCYFAITGQGAWVEFHNRKRQQILPSPVTDLKGACIAAYVGRPKRLVQFGAYQALLDRHGAESTLINASGCFGFCLVASSQVDGFIEVARGYRWHDIVSGAHILKEAGGVVKTLDYCELVDPLRFEAKEGERDNYRPDKKDYCDPRSEEFQVERYCFIAAATSDLAGQLAHEIGKKMGTDLVSGC